MSAWKVYYDGNFWGHHGRDHAGREIRIDKWFMWADRQWWIPAAYSCGKGLVMDFCMRIEAEQIQAFIKRWNLSAENDSCECFTKDQQMEMERENPLNLDFTPQLEANGKKLRMKHGCAICYNLCLPEGTRNEREAERAADHYHLDTAYGWVIYRYAFPWKSGRRSEISSLLLTMIQRPAALPGAIFSAKREGDKVSFTHPVSGEEYVLTVLEIRQQTLPLSSTFGSERWEYPSHFCTMRYTLCPEIPESELSIIDSAECDQPRPKEGTHDECQPGASSGVTAVGMIGGADGPTTIIISAKNEEKSRIASSALHYAPVTEVEWRMIFREKPYDETSVKLF